MVEFPNLKEGQVAIVFADAKTGQVLDDKFILVINDKQNIYTIFNSIKESVIYASKVLEEKKDIEIVIYSERNDVLRIFNNFGKKN